jgi:hypothetical protein
MLRSFGQRMAVLTWAQTMRGTAVVRQTDCRSMA